MFEFALFLYNIQIYALKPKLSGATPTWNNVILVFDIAGLQPRLIEADAVLARYVHPKTQE